MLLRSQLQALRQSLPAQELAERGDISLAVTHCLASVQLKFMWVDELPYLVWQAGPGRKNAGVLRAFVFGCVNQVGTKVLHRLEEDLL